MNRRNLSIVCALGLALIACSDSDNKQADQTTQSKGAAPTIQAPAQSGQQQGQRQLTASQQAALAAGKGLPKQGKVLEMMHAAGYTYMNVDTGAGKPMWIAASMMRIKPEQNIKWTDAAVMNNFTSKSLHRTFDQILFVSNAQVVE
ncbi:MAG: hypothetical protein V3R49_00735 [Gammaproteobacteria bacterium]